MALSRRRRLVSAGYEGEGVTLRRPHAGLLRRERRDLQHTREELIHELGGLMVEMYRRADYRDELLAQACAQVIAVDERIDEIDALLDARRQRPACVCGVPLLAGARFCPNCGRGLAGVTSLPQHPRPEEG